MNYFLHAPFLLTRLLLILGGLVLLIIWNFIFEHDSILTRLKSLNIKTLSYTLVQIIFFYPQVFGVRFLSIPDSFLSPIFNIIGLLIFYLGLFLATWARITMGRSWGMPGSWDDKREEKLITTGPFKYTRNPIYLGLLMMCFGFELSLNSYLIILTIPIFFYFKWEIGREEKILEREFGKEYLLYEQKAPRFF